jgi:GTP-binding protein
MLKYLIMSSDFLILHPILPSSQTDFGGEVERVLNMADGVLLVVDSVEGPKPQTRFVLDKALRKGLKALVVVNKIDRPAARPEYVVDKVFDLMVELNADDEQCDFKVVYASGLLGKAGTEPDSLSNDMAPLFDAVIGAIDPPKFSCIKTDSLQCMVSNIDYDAFKGKMGVSRISEGTVRKNQAVALVHPEKPKKTGRIVSIHCCPHQKAHLYFCHFLLNQPFPFPHSTIYSQIFSYLTTLVSWK